MNIFVLDLDPKVAARYHCDKHIISQLKESIQMLCSALLRHDNATPLTVAGTPHKGGYPNHPCTKWAGEGLLNYQWLWDLAYALGEEACYRFDKEPEHYHNFMVLRNGSLPRNPENFPTPAMRTPFANATNEWLKDDAEWEVKGKLRLLTAIDIYRLYYIVDKCHMTAVDMQEANLHYKDEHKLGKVFDEFSIWTKRGAPEFMGDRFYAQQCEYFKIKPAELIHMGRYPEHEDSIKLRAKMERKLGSKSTGTATTSSKRRTKADELIELSEVLAVTPKECDYLLKLTMPDMVKLRMAIPDVNRELELVMPTGRTKAPYIAAIMSVFPNTDIAFDKLTVVALKDLLEHFGVQ